MQLLGSVLQKFRFIHLMFLKHSPYDPSGLTRFMNHLLMKEQAGFKVKRHRLESEFSLMICLCNADQVAYTC